MALADPARWERLKALLADAADLDPDARAAFLDRLGDAELRADLDGLLAAHDEAEAADRFEEPALGAEVGPSVRNRLPDDARVGPYRLAGEVGQGGMGTVFRAERADGAFEQTVALKVLSHAFASPDAARRFRAERQILARLEHPHVARLLDGGVAAGGPLGRDLPWLAMEFVDGVPLTAYVREAGLRVEGRVRLFLQVCEAVAYAHRNLVVHRDLKPSNILVAEDDRRAPQAKLLDFGIAKLVGKDLGSDAASLAEALTRTGMQVMTPEYAAPEQVRGEAVTTATDVYALGVVLYELLAGQRPYDVAGLSPSEVERTICDTAPTRPSAAIQAAERPVDRSLRGDLDTIVLKALAKEPGQRYATADALAADLRRYLAGEPVAAQPATAGYRARKFVARHRTSVTVAALLSLALLVGLGSVLWQGRIAALERDRAEAAADQATAVTAFLRSTLAAAKPREGQAVPPSELRIVDALRPAAAAAADAFPEQPEVRAAVLHTLGETYLELGLYDEAEAPLRAALALRDSFHLGPHPERIETLDALGLLGLWEPTITGADSFYLRSLDLRRQRYGQQSAEYAVGLARQTERLLEYGDPAEAVAVAEEAVGAALAAAGPRSEAMGEALFVLGTTRMRVERYAAADSALSALLNLALEITPPSDPRLGELHAVLGATRILRGQPERAEPVLRRVLDFRTARYDPGHPYLAEAQQLYAIVLAEEGRYGEAEQLLRTALPTLATGNPYSFSAPLAVAELAAVGAAQGRPVALDSLRAAVDALGESLGPEHAWTRRAAGHLAAVQRSP